MFSQNDFRMTKILFITMTVVVLLMAMMPLAFGQLPAEVDETSIAVTYNEIAGSRGWGGLAAVPVGNGHIAGIAQGGGNVIRGKYHAEYNFPVSVVDFKVFTDGVFKGSSLGDLGRQSDIGLAIELNSIENVPISIGIFGRSAGPFGPPNARDDLENLGYDPNSLDGRDLETLKPPPSGLSFKAGNSLNVLIGTEVHLPYSINLAVRAMPEIAGEGDNPVHQIVFTPSTSLEVGDNVNIEMAADVGFQTFEGEIERELATLVALKLSF